MIRNGFKEASTDPKQIEEWWTTYPNANIAIATGEMSGLVVLDIDNKNGKDGSSTLLELENQHGTLPPTLKQSTPSGGYHLFFQYPGTKTKSRTNIREGLDSRADGGYVVAAPSISPAVGTYVWKDPEAKIAEPPEWLISLINDHGKTTTESVASTPISRDERRRIEAALKYVDPDPQDPWRDMGMALHDRSPSSEAYDLWTAWSRSSHEFDEVDQRKTWGSFNSERINGERVTLGTLFYRAQENGWDSQRFVATEIEDAINQEDDPHALMTTIAGQITREHLSAPVRHKLRKLIANKTGCRIRDLETDASTLNKTGIDQDRVAISVIDSIGADNIRFAKSRFWLWNPCGVWRAADEQVVKGHIHEKLQMESAPLTRTVVDSICELLKTKVFREEEQTPLVGDVINCPSGELHLINGQWEIRPHDKSAFRTTPIPVRYQPDVTCPEIEKFLYEIFEGDHETNRKVELILELVGYSLVTHCRYETFAMFIGTSANGKSVLLKVIMALVGKVNTAAVQPAQLTSSHQRASLQSKLVNLVTEIPQGSVIPDDILKGLTSGEPTNVDEKYGHPFLLEPYATCIFATNHLPHTKDFSTALMRRAQIVPFNRVFSEEEQDKQLVDKLTTAEELEGLLVLALEAYAGVVHRGGFTKIEEVEDAKRGWRLDADQVAQFVDECCKAPAPGEKVKSGDLYKAFRHWTQEQGITHRVTQNNFTRRLGRLGVTPIKGADGVRELHDIKLLDGYAYLKRDA